MKTLDIIKPIRGALNHLAVAIAVTVLPAVANDDFADAIALTGGGSGQTGAVASGTQTGTNNIGATLEVGEPGTVNYPGGGTSSFNNTVWFKWTCPADGNLSVSTLGSTSSVPDEYDAVLGIYTGASVDALTPLNGSPNDTALQESMTVAVTTGTTYHIQVAGWESAVAANILLTWNYIPGPANDFFVNAIDLTGVGSGQTGSVTSGTQSGTDNVDATLEVGEPNGSGGINTVWFKWTSPADGNLTVNTLGSTTSTPDEWDAVLGIYTGASVGALTPLGDSPQDLAVPEEMTVAVTAGTTYFIQTAGWEAAVAANILLTWTFAEPVAQADILAFGPGAVIGPVVANEAVISWNLPPGTNLATLAPAFTLSPGATCTVDGLPVNSGDIVSFSGGPVVFTVTAEGASPIVNDYTVTAVIGKEVLWNVAGGGDWDEATANWFEQPSGPVTTFANGDAVTFNNAAGGTITIASGMSPDSTTVGGTGTYTFAGGPLAGGDLTVSAPGTLNISNGTYSSAISISGDGAIVRNLESGINQSLNYDMSSFTGTLTVTTGMTALNPFFSPSFVAPAGGTIRIANNTTAYLGWQGTTFDTTVELAGSVDNGEGLGLLRGDTATLNGAVVLAANSSIGSAGGTFTINAAIGDGGNGFGFTKVGGGTVILTATNTYAGATSVTGGTLQCDVPDALGSGALSINSGGAKLNLNYVGTKTVASLTLGGVAQTAPGTYGSVASLANFPDDTYFTPGSTGTVTLGGASGFTTWADANAPGQTPAQDHDNDGVENGIEYFMGETGSSFTALPGLDGTNTVTWPMISNYDGTYEVQTSPDLSNWTNVDPRPEPSGGNLSYLLPTGLGKQFVRLLVTPTP